MQSKYAMASIGNLGVGLLGMIFARYWLLAHIDGVDRMEMESFYFILNIIVTNIWVTKS